MRWWKWIGLAGLVGAAAAGAVVVTQRRRRTWRDYDPDELRSRLHARLAESRATVTTTDAPDRVRTGV